MMKTRQIQCLVDQTNAKIRLELARNAANTGFPPQRSGQQQAEPATGSSQSIQELQMIAEVDRLIAETSTEITEEVDRLIAETSAEMEQEVDRLIAETSTRQPPTHTSMGYAAMP